jgi:hypothetical protein
VRMGGTVIGANLSDVHQQDGDLALDAQIP